MKKILNSSGQALVTILFIGIIGITIATAAAIFALENMRSASVSEQGVDAYYIAEAGVQEGLIRILRDPNYKGTQVGQPLIIGDGSAVISTSSAGTNITITSIGTYHNSVRKVQAKTVYNNGVLTISSWKEIK
jgi:hypothetical protein